VVLFFGPPLAIASVVFLVDISEANRKSKLSAIFAKLALSVNESNSFIALATNIASIFRIRQVPPLYELYFIKQLARYQCALVMGSSLPLLMSFGIDKRKKVSIGIYLLVLLALFIAVQVISGFSTSEAGILEQITTDCMDRKGYQLPWDFKLDTGGDIRFFKRFNAIYWPILLSLIGLMIPFQLFFLFKLYGLNWKRLQLDIKRYIQTNLAHFRLSTRHKKYLRFAVVTIYPTLTILWIIFSVLLGRQLQMERNNMRNTSGSAYEDSQWGFGQVTVLLMWGPLFNDIVMEYIGKKEF
jgi:hypothetical protein